MRKSRLASPSKTLVQTPPQQLGRAQDLDGAPAPVAKVKKSQPQKKLMTRVEPFSFEDSPRKPSVEGKLREAAAPESPRPASHCSTSTRASTPAGSSPGGQAPALPSLA